MSVFTILLTAAGLAMDALAVSISSGPGLREHRQRRALKMAAFFGGFQAIMPAVGYALGVTFREWVAAADHWIAFGLLAAIGGKMIHESMSNGGDASRRTDPFSTRTLTLLAIATSIDALAAGVTLPLLRAPMALTLATIGLVTFALSLAGVYAGRRFGARLGPRLDAVGGVVLIGIGARILALHLAGRG